MDSFWNTSVTELLIPKSVKYMEDYSLSTMLKLVILIFEERISLNMGKSTFHDCMNLHTVIFPANIIYPETLIFHNSNLESVFLCSKTVILNNNHFFKLIDILRFM